MYDRVYLYSRDWGGDNGPELIGTIVKNGDEYTFSYENPNDNKFYKVIKPFINKYKIYGTEECLTLIQRQVPVSKDDCYIQSWLKLFDMKEFDMWELLINNITKNNHISFGKPDCTGNVFWSVELCGY